MTDREMLEFAAKAAGWSWWRSKHGYLNLTNPDGASHTACHGRSRFDPHTGEEVSAPAVADALEEIGWDPQSYSEDCEALEAKLMINITWGDSHVSAEALNGFGPCSESFDSHDGDRCAARRYASTRAAAEIGKAMP